MAGNFTLFPFRIPLTYLQKGRGMRNYRTLKTRFFDSMTYMQGATDIVGKQLISLMRFAAVRFADNWHALCKWLEKKGWKRLGYGFFANVYATPCGRFALKLARGGTKTGYDSYARFAAANPSNPYLPTVYIHTRTDFGMMTLLERLTPLTDALHPECVDIQKRLKADVLDCKNTDTALSTVLMHLHPLHERLDLHPSNFMARGDQLVITDPLAG